MSKRLPIIPTLIVAVAIALMIGLGVWQLQRAKWKEGLLERYAAAQKLPPIAWPTIPMRDAQLPLFRYATGVCLHPVGKRAIAGENRAGEPGYVQVIDCQTGIEGPGLTVELGWSKDPNARFNWAGGPVSGIIVPDKRTRMRLVADGAPPGLLPSRVPDVSAASSVTPAGHRMYAATWFSFAVIALIVYGLAVRKRMKQEPRK
jgi:cytochrome oxidase assembly protein ShyY1